MALRVQACTGCHGREGRAAPDGYQPRIAGKPAGYLLNQLQHFQTGRRQNAAMRHLIRHLPEPYLAEMAGHFAAQDLPYPPPLPAQADAAALARGEALARRGDDARRIPACQACHGAALTGVQPTVPGLLGLPRDYVVGQVGAWRSGLRRAHAPDCMADIAKTLTEADLYAVASWLAAQPLPANPHPAAALPAPMPVACGSGPGGAK